MQIRIQSRHVRMAMMLLCVMYLVVLGALYHHLGFAMLSKSLEPTSSQKQSLVDKNRQTQHRPKQENIAVIINKLPNFNLTGLLLSKPSRPRPKNPPPMKLKTPVIVVGLPKAGTSSIFSFFHCNGYSTQHWYCCHPQNDPRRIDASYYNTTTTKKTPKLMAECMLNNLALNHQNTSHGGDRRRLLFEGCGQYQVYTEINGPRPHLRTKISPGVSLGASDTKIVGTLLDDGSYDPIPPFERIFLPQHFHLDLIHQQFPGATFVLNQRPAASWVSSVLDWRARSTIHQPPYHQIVQAPAMPISELAMEFSNEFWQVHSQRQKLSSNANHHDHPNPHAVLPPQNYSRPEMERFLSTLYNTHAQKIRDFVQSHPSHTLVDIDITNKTVGQQLADIFGVQYADCWTQWNRNTKRTVVPP